MIDDPAVDAVLIATPDHWHAIQSVMAMRAGKHVYCQKPMSLGISEGKEMARVAKETGVTLKLMRIWLWKHLKRLKLKGSTW